MAPKSNDSLGHITPKLPDVPAQWDDSNWDNNWEHAKSFGSESEVLIVNYSRIQHEKSLEMGSDYIDVDKTENSKKIKRTDNGRKNGRKDLGKCQNNESILQGLVDKRKVGLGYVHKDKEVQKNAFLKDDIKKEKEDKIKGNLLEATNVGHSKSKPKKLYVVQPDHIVQSCATNQATLHDPSGKEDTLRNSEQVNLKNETKEPNILETENLNDLKSTLQQCLLKKFSETNILENSRGKQKDLRKIQRTEPEEQRKSPQELQKKEGGREKGNNEQKKEVSTENQTPNKNKEIEEQPQKDRRKSKVKKERKCNLSGHRLKIKDRHHNPPTTMHLSETQKFLSRKKLTRLGEYFFCLLIPS